MPNAFVTPTWVYREWLIRFYSQLPGFDGFVQRIRAMTDAEVERLNERLCEALASADGWDEDDDDA